MDQIARPASASAFRPARMVAGAAVGVVALVVTAAADYIEYTVGHAPHSVSAPGAPSRLGSATAARPVLPNAWRAPSADPSLPSASDVFGAAPVTGETREAPTF